jgi:hypothetical protein
MANYTIEASLEVDAACTFPQTFPFTFGPSATLVCNHSASTALACTSSILVSAGERVFVDAGLGVTANRSGSLKMDGLFDAPKVVTATADVRPSQAWLADVALTVSIYRVFPYTFPFVFEQSFDTMGQGQEVGGELVATAQASGSAHRSVGASATQNITANAAATLLQGFEEAGDSTLSVTASRTTAMTRGQRASSALIVEAETTPTKVAMGGRIDPHLTVEASGVGVTHWGTHLAAGHEITAVPRAGLSMSALFATALQVSPTTNASALHDQLMSVALEIVTDPDVSLSLQAMLDASLSVQALMMASIPEDAGFFPFYVR